MNKAKASSVRDEVGPDEEREGGRNQQAQGNSCYLGNEHSRSCIGVPKG
jgi:hypothetical protein